MPAKGPFTVKLSISITPWMENGIEKVRAELEEKDSNGWWRRPYTTADIMRLAVTELLNARGITSADLQARVEDG